MPFTLPMIIKIAIVLVAGTLLAGCAATNPAAAQKETNCPAWVLNPDKPGFVGVVGAAPRQHNGGREAQYRVAQMKAYQELAQMQRVRVTSTNRAFVEDRGGKVTRDADVQTQLQSHVALGPGEAEIIDEWVEPNTGKLYLWLVMPK